MGAVRPTMASEEKAQNAEQEQEEEDEKVSDSQQELSAEDIERRDAILSRRTKKRVYFGQKRDEVFKYEATAISEKFTLFAMSEYIKELITSDYTNIERIIDVPRDVDGADGRLQFLVCSMKILLIEVGLFVVYLSPQCNQKNCSKMQATTKFRYRCSAHRKPKDCNSIQYMVHTLDLFTEKMSSPQYIYSNEKIPEKKAKKDMGDLCRRVYRIFAHSFFHHQQLFDHYEATHLLCTRFILFFRKYQLVPNQLFQREIQIPAASLYFSRKARKEKLKKYFAKRREFEKQQKNVLENAQDAFMKDSAVAELDYCDKRDIY